jgi:peroxiredoxin Q/BCP
MSKIAINQPVPDFSVTATDNQTIHLSDYRGKNFLLYFYPKDNTPGCTLEGQQFRDHHSDFCALNTEILGVSRDSLRTHENFRSKHHFPFPLISDEDEILCKLFDVIKVKKMYGKESLGVERSTFLIDASGVLRRLWRKVKVDGHVAEVLGAVRELN